MKHSLTAKPIEEINEKQDKEVFELEEEIVKIRTKMNNNSDKLSDYKEKSKQKELDIVKMTNKTYQLMEEL